MVDTMQNEGFLISDRELIRLRLRLKLLLRESVPRPKGEQAGVGAVHKKKVMKKVKAVPGKGLINQLGNAIPADEASSDDSREEEPPAQEQKQGESAEQLSPTILEHDAAPLSTEQATRKQLRQEQLKKESDEKWRTRKRRRRTRGWAGLPADAPGEPPRFPSETTIDEAKAHLRLDNEMYRKMRERFLEICKQEGIIKKTIAGPERWAQIVQQLIREDTHLSMVFLQEPEVMQGHDALFRPKGQKALSIDVVCMDVTKRLRTMDSRMTLADVKNILVLNPHQTRHIRTALAARLKADNFTNKQEAGEQHWTDLKTAWVNESELLVNALSQGEADPEYSRKLRAIELLARDVLKRMQQEKTANDPAKKRQIHQGPGPGPAPPVILPQVSTRTRTQSDACDTTTMATTHANHHSLITLAESADLQIDPSLLLAASDAAILPTLPYQTEQQHRPPPQYESPQQHYQPASNIYPSRPQIYNQTASTTASPLPIYFRLHLHSTTPFPAKTMWLSILHQPSVSAIKNLAVQEHPSCTVLRLEGLVTYRGEQGEREVKVEVGDDEELSAYLGHVQNASGGSEKGKVTFVVLLGAGDRERYA
jgi:hypothetical protein